MAKKSMMDILKERLEQLDQKGGSGNNNLNFLNIKDGRNVIRILPAREDAEVFYEEGFVHYGVGANGKDRGKMVVCPTSKNEDAKCPVCEKSKALWKKSSDKDDDYAKQAKAVGRKKRVYYNAVSRDDLDSGLYEQREVEKDGKTVTVWWNTKEDKEESPVKVLATGVGVLKDIIGIILDPEYGDITHPEEGLDAIITKKGSGQYGTSYEVKTVRKESEIGVDGWEDLLNDLTVLFVTKEYDEIKKMMETGSDVDDEDEDEDDYEAPKKSSKRSSKEEDEDDTADDSNEDSSEDDDVEDEIQKAIQARKNRK